MYLEFDFTALSIKKSTADHTFQRKNYSLFLEGTCWQKGDSSCLKPIELLRLIIEKKNSVHRLLEGNYLIIVIEQTSKSIRCVNDLSGSIPLFYTLNGNCFICSTEVKNIPDTELLINQRNISSYYKKGCICSPHTIFSNVKKMKADSSLHVTLKGIEQIIPPHDTAVLSLEDCIADMKKNIENYCSKTQPAILVTGGMDSSLLVHLAKALKPVLYFGAVISSFTKKYNYYSIKKGLSLAKTMSLKYNIIPITYKDYIKNYLGVIKIMDEPLYDPDLPAVLAFFKHISNQDKKHKCVISGMGVDELCNLPSSSFGRYANEKIAPEINVHKKIGRCCGIDFYAPFLNRSFFSYLIKTPLRKRKNKVSLREVIRNLKILPPEYTNQLSLHSDIPDRFINDACCIYSQKIKKQSKNNERFKDTLLKLWIQEFNLAS